MCALLRMFGLEKSGSATATIDSDAPLPAPVFPAAQVPTLDPFCGNSECHAARDAAQRGDFQAIRRVLDTISDPNDRTLVLQTITKWPEPPVWLDEWVKSEPTSALPRLVRGNFGVQWAWEARGTAFADKVGEEAFKIFSDRLKRADDDLQEAARLDPRDAAPWVFMLHSARGLQLGLEEVARRFSNCIRCPGGPQHREAHSSMLQSLCVKWGGSHDVMFKFADGVAAEAPLGSPVYTLVPEAHLERWASASSDNDPGADTYFQHRDVRKSLHEAATAAFHPDACRPTMDSITARNYFALAFWMASDFSAAAHHFAAIGNWISEYPWAYLGDPVQMFTKAQARCAQGRMQKLAA